jgi:hypothetical protein
MMTGFFSGVSPFSSARFLSRSALSGFPVNEPPHVGRPVCNIFLRNPSRSDLWECCPPFGFPLSPLSKPSLLSSLHAWPERGIQGQRPCSHRTPRHGIFSHRTSSPSGAAIARALNEAGPEKRPFTHPQRIHHYWRFRGGINAPALLLTVHTGSRLKSVRPKPPRLPFSITVCLINDPMPVISTSIRRIRR